jgi:hypothetical protein
VKDEDLTFRLEQGRVVLFVGQIEIQRFRTQIFRQKFCHEFLLVPLSEVFGASDVPAFELVLVSCVNDPI